METPPKGKPSRRVATTLATQKNETIIYTTENEKRSRIKTQIWGELSSVKKRLNFESQKAQHCAQMTLNQARIQHNYRKNMVSYLDQKFGEAIAQIPIKTQRQYKIARNNPNQKQNKLKEYIACTFQEFIYSIRAQNASEYLTQYQVGNVLKNMHFIKSLLDQRLTIIKLCASLQQLSIYNFFMFIMHFYVLNQESNISDIFKKQVIQDIHHLFDQQGFIISINCLYKYYEKGEKIGKNSQYRFMRLNRQNRHTSSSISHSLNRRKR